MDRPERSLRIDMVVQGRFHAFDLARALIARGHDVHLITNYPSWVPPRWGISPTLVSARAWHGALARVYYRGGGRRWLAGLEPWLHRSFARWAAGQLRRQTDVVHVFSGVAEEVFAALPLEGPPVRLLVRGSSHVRTQHRLLAEEEDRCGFPVEKPSAWMIAREEREYGCAHRIIVLSSFARDSFVREGVPAAKLAVVPLAAEGSRFMPSHAAVRERRRRIAAGEPLRVLMVGSFTARKGALDFIAVARKLHPRMHFRFVGDGPASGSRLERESTSIIEFVPRVPEAELAAHYAWGDVFCLPTIEDGFAAVLAQALAARLPVLATRHSAAPDVIREGQNGWVVPIRDAQALCHRLVWCDTHREALGAMLESWEGPAPARTWDDVARDIEGLADD